MIALRLDWLNGLNVGRLGMKATREGDKTYTSTPLVNSCLGSWTTPLTETFSMSYTARMVQMKMNISESAS